MMVLSDNWWRITLKWGEQAVGLSSTSATATSNLQELEQYVVPLV